MHADSVQHTLTITLAISSPTRLLEASDFYLAVSATRFSAIVP